MNATISSFFMMGATRIDWIGKDNNRSTEGYRSR